MAKPRKDKAQDDAYQVPEGIANFTEEKKKDVARDMLHKTKLNNQQVADITGVSIRAVATMRGHAQGILEKVNDIKEKHRAEAAASEQQQIGGELDPVEEQQVVDGTPVHDIDERARQRSPDPVESRVTHVESGLRDLTSRLNDVDRSVSRGFSEVKNMLSTRGDPSPEPDAPSLGHPPSPFPPGEGTMTAQFEGFYEKVPISSRQRTLFEMWRAKQNKMARIDPNHYVPFTGDIGDLITDLALPEFFKLRGATIVYTEKEMTAETS